MRQSTPTRYDLTSQAFHWVTAITVTAAFVLGPGGFGRLMRQGVDPATHADIVWHESLGLLVFALTLLRLLWLAVRPAAPKIAMTPWMHMASKAAHWALWILLLALPITAIVALGSRGHPLTLLGGLRIDEMPVIANAAFASWFDWGDVHQWLGDVIMWIAGLHAAAALFHHFILKDSVLRTMLPMGRR
jgi:cytochrome b561